MPLTPNIKSSITNSVLCWLATTDGDGQPNVSPKEMFTSVGDDQLIIANIAANGEEYQAAAFGGRELY